MSDPKVKTVLTGLIENSSYLFPSNVDLEFLYPNLSTEQAVAELLSSGDRIIALTRGEQGSTIYSNNNDPLVLSGHVVDEVDPTGAGDCFCGTFLSMIAQGQTLEQSGRYANAAGAIAVTKRGPMEGNSDLAMIEDFIKHNPATTTA